MTTKNAYGVASRALVGLSMLFFLNEAVAEDKLVKGEAIYLGWAQPENQFRTCFGNLLDVADGSLQPTRDTCIKTPGGITPFAFSPFRITGEVAHIDPSSQRLDVKKDTGTTEAFYYKPSPGDSGLVDLQHLNVGDKIVIMGPAAGRAETIVR